MPRYYTAEEIINRVAPEFGLSPVADPFSSSDDSFVQLRNLLDSLGKEMIDLFEWQETLKEYSFTTAAMDTGKYDLPDDYDRIVEQTIWDRTNRVAVAGPLSPQDWEYLKGRGLASDTIYLVFREMQGQLWVHPQPPPVGLEVAFEYVSINWVGDSQNPGTRIDKLQNSADICYLPPMLLIKGLRAMFESARGFDNSTASGEFNALLERKRMSDNGAKVLNAGRNRRGFPYLSGFYSLPDTGYGG